MNMVLVYWALSFLGLFSFMPFVIMEEISGRSGYTTPFMIATGIGVSTAGVIGVLGDSLQTHSLALLALSSMSGAVGYSIARWVLSIRTLTTLRDN